MVEAIATEHAQSYVRVLRVLKDLDGVYITEMGPRAKTIGVDIMLDYKKKTNTLPAFSSLLTKSSEAAGSKQGEVVAHFYSLDSYRCATQRSRCSRRIRERGRVKPQQESRPGNHVFYGHPRPAHAALYNWLEREGNSRSLGSRSSNLVVSCAQ